MSRSRPPAPDALAPLPLIMEDARRAYMAGYRTGTIESLVGWTEELRLALLIIEQRNEQNKNDHGPLFDALEEASSGRSKKEA